MTIDPIHNQNSHQSSSSRRISHSPICCFVSDNHPPTFNNSDYSDSVASDSSDSASPSQSASSSTGWLKSLGRHDLPIKEKGTSFISRLIRRRRRRKRLTNITAEFRYDPHSYALNFEDEAARFDDDERLMNFSDRLRACTEESRMYVCSGEMSVAWSC